jgi:hypothetical protein
LRWSPRTAFRDVLPGVEDGRTDPAQEFLELPLTARARLARDDEVQARHEGDELAARARLEAAQTERVFDDLGTALASAGAAWADVAMLTIYVVGYDGSQAPVIGQAIRARFAAGRLPACSLVGVQALADPRFLIEVQAVAVMPTGSRA